LHQLRTRAKGVDLTLDDVSSMVMIAALVSLVAATSVSLPDLHGKDVQVLPSPASKGVVAFFVLSGCPNANAYVPEMNRLAKHYGPKGWKFYLVYVDAPANVGGLIKNARQFGYTFPVLHGQGELVKLAHATKSPEAAVFSPRSKLVYHGRIDDRFYALGKQRLKPRVHDLRDTLDAVDSRKPIPHARTEAVGCFIPRG